MHLFHSNTYVFIFKNVESFVVASKATGLDADAVTATYVVMSLYQSAGQSHNIQIDNSFFERVEEFRYLGKITILFRKKLRAD
jgi:hypothetical protein